MPATRNAISANTLISAAQNSSSPNHSTEIRFIAKTTANAISAEAHCGTAAKAVQ